MPPRRGRGAGGGTRPARGPVGVRGLRRPGPVGRCGACAPGRCGVRCAGPGVAAGSGRQRADEPFEFDPDAARRPGLEADAVHVGERRRLTERFGPVRVPLAGHPPPLVEPMVCRAERELPASIKAGPHSRPGKNTCAAAAPHESGRAATGRARTAGGAARRRSARVRGGPAGPAAPNSVRVRRVGGKSPAPAPPATAPPAPLPRRSWGGRTRARPSGHRARHGRPVGAGRGVPCGAGFPGARGPVRPTGPGPADGTLPAAAGRVRCRFALHMPCHTPLRCEDPGRRGALPVARAPGRGISAGSHTRPRRHAPRCGAMCCTGDGLGECGPRHRPLSGARARPALTPPPQETA